MNRLGTWFGAAVAAAVVGCGAPSIDDTTWSCTTAADCGDGYLCASGACVIPDNSAVGVESDRILVGMTGPVTTGPAELGSAMRAGIEAHFNYINNTGGVDGRQLELLVRDDGNEPNRAATNLQDMADEVFAYVGAVGNGSSDQLAMTASAQGKILYGTFGGGPALRQTPPNRLVFNLRAGLEEELKASIGYITGVRAQAVLPGNIAVLAEGSATRGVLTTYGQATLDLVGAVLQERYGISPSSIVVAEHVTNRLDVNEAVGTILRWLGDGNRGRDGTGQIVATVVLGTHARPAANFVREIIDELFKIKRGTSNGADYGVDAVEANELVNVARLDFIAPSNIGVDELASELDSFGSYRTAGGNELYCKLVVMTQAVPNFGSAGSGASEYREQLRTFNPNIAQGFVSFEGFLAARAFTEALMAHGPNLSTDGLISTIEGMAPLDLGTGASYDFAPSQRTATDMLWATTLNDACNHVDLDLGDPGTPVIPEGCDENNVCTLTGLIDENRTLGPDRTWLLKDQVKVGTPAKEVELTILPGTTILGDADTVGVLIIKPGSKLLARGTAERPIVFTSSRPAGSRAAGDWGGIVINGNAPINACSDEALMDPCRKLGEGGSGLFGGTDPDDDSGELTYVRVEFAGKKFNDINELNGIALQGVGRGTVIDYVQVHKNSDDGIEFFGGTAEAKHVYITGAQDDSIDWTDGWQGRLQFAVVQQFDDSADRGIEADNWEDDENAVPRSSPVISNVTMVGSSAGDAGMVLRRGTGAQLYSFVVMNFANCFDIDSSATFDNAIVSGSTLTGNLTVSTSMFDCTNNYRDDSGEPVTMQTFIESLNSGNTAGVSAGIVRPTDLVDPDYSLMSGAAARSGGSTPADTWFEAVTYRGGVDPDNDWTEGWTTQAAN